MAKIMISNLLPQDTRTSEACSALTLLISAAIGLGGGVLDAAGLVMVAPIEFWLSAMLLMGGLQFVSLAFNDLEVLRAISAWINGLGLVWLGLTTSVGHFDPSDVCVCMLGLLNIYAAVIVAALLSHK